jgi:hypothetical protein
MESVDADPLHHARPRSFVSDYSRRHQAAESRKLYVVLIGGMFGLMLLFETPPAVAAIATAFMAMQCAVGGRFLHRIWPAVNLGSAGRHVFGAVLVYSLLTLGQFIGWAIFGFAYTWALVMLVVFTTFWTISAEPRTTDDHAESRDESAGWAEGAVLLFGALAFLLNDFGWITPLSISAAIVALGASFASRVHPIVFGASAVTVVVVGVVMSLSIRSELWWFLTDDYWMFDALISSLKSVGPFADYSTLGHSTWQYHVFAYQYAAFIEQITGAKSLIILSRVMPVVTAVLASGMTMAFLSRYTKLGKRGQLACIVIFALTYRYTFQSPSYAVGFVVLIAALLVWMNRHYIVRFSHWIFVVPPVIAAAVATKFSNIFIVSAVVAISQARLLMAKTELQRWRLVVSTAVTIGVVGTAAVALASPRLRAEFAYYDINGFGREFLGDHSAIRNRLWRHYLLASVLFSLVAPVMLALASIRRRRDRGSDADELELAGICAAVLALSFGLLGGNSNGRYFVESALTIGALVAITVAAAWRPHLTAGRFVLLLTCAVIGVASVRLRPIINGPSEWETALRAMVVNGSGIIATPLVMFAVILYVTKSERARSIASLALVGVLTMNFTADVTGLGSREVGDPLGTSQAEYDLARGSVAEQTVAYWLRTNSPRAALVASNYFCDACAGEDWIDEDIDRFSRDIQPLKYSWGGSNYVLPSLSERSFLIQGPRFLTGMGGLSEESERRLRLSLEFANQSSVRAYDELRERGVSFFVIDRSTSTSDSWREFGRVEFENERFSVVNLSID